MPALDYNDFGVTYSDYTLPLISELWNGWSCRVGVFHQATLPVTVTASGTDVIIGSGEGLTGVSSMKLNRPGTIVGFEADFGRNAWVSIPGGVDSYVEVYSGAAQSPMNGNVQWTFIPIGSQGPTPIIFDIAGGTLTANFPGVRHDFSIQCKATHNIASNNSDTDFSIVAVPTGTGLDILPDIQDAFMSPRSGAFQKTFATFGMWLPAAATDTISYNATENGQGASDVDLDEFYLIVEV